jgi:hypothetical protein
MFEGGADRAERLFLDHRLPPNRFPEHYTRLHVER